MIEFETIMRKRDQLDAIIQQALRWKFPMEADKDLYMVADPSSRSAYTWAGAKEAELKRQRPAWPVDTEAGSESQSAQESAPVAPALVPFDPQSDLGTGSDASLGNHSQFDANTEKFYVVFLTWRKQRVQE